MSTKPRPSPYCRRGGPPPALYLSGSSRPARAASRSRRRCSRRARASPRSAPLDIGTVTIGKVDLAVERGRHLGGVAVAARRGARRARAARSRCRLSGPGARRRPAPCASPRSFRIWNSSGTTRPLRREQQQTVHSHHHAGAGRSRYRLPPPPPAQVPASRRPMRLFWCQRAHRPRPALPGELGGAGGDASSPRLSVPRRRAATCTSAQRRPTSDLFGDAFRPLRRPCAGSAMA